MYLFPKALPYLPKAVQELPEQKDITPTILHGLVFSVMLFVSQQGNIFAFRLSVAVDSLWRDV